MITFHYTKTREGGLYVRMQVTCSHQTTSILIPVECIHMRHYDSSSPLYNSACSKMYHRFCTITSKGLHILDIPPLIKSMCKLKSNIALAHYIWFPLHAHAPSASTCTQRASFKQIQSWDDKKQKKQIVLHSQET